MRASRAFTLIELLVVVAIIGLLAAIAITNMLAAKVKANVARVEADLKAFSTALEAYAIDNEIFPDSAVGPGSRAYDADPPKPGRDKPNPGAGYTYYPGHTTRSMLTVLSTPVAYISSVDYDDPFLGPQNPLTSDNESFRYPYSYLYFGFGTGKGFWGTTIKERGYLLCSVGPDGVQNYIEHMIWQFQTNWVPPPNRRPIVYSPTNGLKSTGDIYRAGGMRGFNVGGGH